MSVSPLLIGLTVMAMATSAPELVVSLQAVWTDRPAIAVGNVIGSNIANVLLILGIASIIATLPCHKDLIQRVVALMLAGSLLLAVLVYSGSIGWWHGMALIAVLIALLAYLFIRESRTGNCTAA